MSSSRDRGSQDVHCQPTSGKRVNTSKAVQLTHHHLSGHPRLRDRVLAKVEAGKPIPERLLNEIGMIPVSGSAARAAIAGACVGVV